MTRAMAVALVLVAWLAAPTGPDGSLALLSEARATSSTFTTATTFEIDLTAPEGAMVQTANGASTAGRPEAGDTVTFTYSEPMDPRSILAGWNGGTAVVVVHIADGGLGVDSFTVRDATNTSQLPLGTLNLGGIGYVSADRTFGASGTPSSMTISGSTVVIVLGTASGTVRTALVAADMTWVPSSAATDLAGNPCDTMPVVESDPLLADVEF